MRAKVNISSMQNVVSKMLGSTLSETTKYKVLCYWKEVHIL